MSENTLTIEYALSHLEPLKFLEENKPDAFYCSRLSQEGIIIISNLRMSFFFIGNDNEFKIEHMVFSMINKIVFHITNTTNYINVTYAYTKQKFSFMYKKDILKVKNILETHIPDMLEIETFQEGTQIFEDIPKQISISTNMLKIDESKPLISFEEDYFKPVNKQNIKKVIFLFILGTIAYNIFINFSELKFNSSSILKYGFGFIQVMQAESQMFKISQSLNNYYSHSQTFSENFQDFIRKNFKSKINADPSLDPWGGKYILKEEKNSFKIISFGPDRYANTFDDVVRDFSKVKFLPEDSF